MQYTAPTEDKVYRDSRGTELVEGARVAYNRSGDIAFGTIKKIHKNQWKHEQLRGGGQRWYLEFELHIENELGPLFKIKNPNSFLII